MLLLCTKERVNKLYEYRDSFFLQTSPSLFHTKWDHVKDEMDKTLKILHDSQESTSEGQSPVYQNFTCWFILIALQIHQTFHLSASNIYSVELGMSCPILTPGHLSIYQQQLSSIHHLLKPGMNWENAIGKLVTRCQPKTVFLAL